MKSMPDKGIKTARRYSTSIRDREVWRMYDAMRRELGSIAPYVAKSYYYDRLNKETGLSYRTLQTILNDFGRME